MRSRHCLLLLASVLSAQGIPDRPENLNFKPFVYEAPRVRDHKVLLKNGIPVFLAEDPQSAFLRIRIGFRAGGYLDPAGKEGLASLLGIVWRQGGTHDLPAEEFDRRLDRMAARLESDFSRATGELRLRVLTKDAEEGLDLLFKVLLGPALEAGRIELGRKQLLAELERSEEDAGRAAETRMEGLLFGVDRPRPTPASLDRIERADLVALHGRILHPANLVVSASGGFDRRWLQGVLDRRLGSLRPGPTAVKSPALPAPRFQRQPCIFLVHRSVSQSVVRLALPGPRRSDPDWETALVMNEVLGARLSTKLRVEHGLTYGIRSTLEEGDLLGRGDWLCTFRTKNRSVATALRLVLAEIEKLKIAPVAETELGAVKDGIIQAFPAFWSNRQNRVETFGNDLLRGWGEDRALDHRARISAVTAANVQSSARAYLDPSKLVVLIVGNTGEVEAGDPKEAPGSLKDLLPFPIQYQPDPVAR